MMEAQSNPERQPVTGGNKGASLACALFAALVLLVPSLRAAIQFDVTIGVEGYIPEASWFPIVCEVNNDGPAFQAVIEVSGGNFNQGYVRQVPVELPTGTRKLVTIPVFCSAYYNSSWDVKLKDTSGRLRADPGPQQPRGLVRRGTVLLGALSRMPSWMPAFQKTAQNQSEYQPVSGRFLTAIPDNAIVLEGMDALYLNSERAAVLKENQARAIESWVNSGGHLIVAIEQISDVNNLAWLRRLVPINLNGTRMVQVGTALEDWLRSPVEKSIAQEAALRGHNQSGRQTKTNVTAEAPFANTPTDGTFATAQLAVATGTVRADGRVLVSIGDAPAIVSSLRGNGRVTVLLFSPEREPVKSWRNQPTFWSRIANVPGRLYVGTDNYYNSGLGTDGIFGAMIDSRQVRKLPIWQLLLMLLLYLAIIGPVDQIWLRKIGRPMLTWITFPCYVALFSGLIYLVGYKLRAGETEWNELHVVDVFPSGEKSEQRGHTFGSIYSPVNERYNFESTGHATAFRSEFTASYSTDQNDRGRIMQTENSFKAEVFVPVWTCQLYVNDWVQTAEAPFFATIEQGANGWVAKIQNRLGKPLTNVRLAVKGHLYELGEIPANQTRQFTQSGTASSSSLADFVNRTANTFENVVHQRGSAFGRSESGHIDNLADASEAVSFLSYRQSGNDQYYNFLPPPTLDLSAAAEQDTAILVAWTAGQSSVKPLNQFNTRRSAVNTLWRMTLPLHSTP